MVLASASCLDTSSFVALEPARCQGRNLNCKERQVRLIRVVIMARRARIHVGKGVRFQPGLSREVGEGCSLHILQPAPGHRGKQNEDKLCLGKDS